MTSPACPLTVRQRCQEDLPALEKVLWEVHQQFGYPADWPQHPAAFIAPPGGGAWVAELGGAVSGQVLLRRAQNSPGRSWEQLTGHPAESLALVSRLFVHPGAAGQGAARRLLQEATGAARKRGFIPALEVYAESHRAIRLYERLGWRRTAEYTGHRLWGSEYPSVYVYVAPEPHRERKLDESLKPAATKP